LRAAVLFAGRRFAVLFLRAVVLFRATVFLAGRRFAALFFALLLLAIAMPCPLSLPRRSVFQDAMRFRRRRSRSLIPPHTP
jgi:hypothetical protein